MISIRSPQPAPSQWLVGAFGLALVIASRRTCFTHGTPRAPGVAAGAPLRPFVAPLATSDLDASANVILAVTPLRPARAGSTCAGGARSCSICSSSGPPRACVGRRAPGVATASPGPVRRRRAAAPRTTASLAGPRWTSPSPTTVTAPWRLYEVASVRSSSWPTRRQIVGRLIGEGWNIPGPARGQMQRRLPREPS